MKFASRSQKEFERSQQAWRQWCEKLHGSSEAHLVSLAQRWAETMEARIKQPPRQVRFVAQKALIDAGGRGLTAAQIREVVLALEKCWYLGAALCNWASGRGYAKPGD